MGLGGGGAVNTTIKTAFQQASLTPSSGISILHKGFGFVAFSPFFLQLPDNLQKLWQLAGIWV